MPISVPGNKVVTDLGHTSDHNLIRQALLDLDANSVKAERTPDTGRWLLTSQDGGTLEVGDTGWRDIRAELLADATEKVLTWSVARVRRVGATVTFQFRGTVGASPLVGTGAAIDLWTLPSGWRTGEYFPTGGVHQDNVFRQLGQFTTANLLTVMPVKTAAGTWNATGIQGGGVWLTSDPWPTVLPGTASTQPKQRMHEEHEPHPTPIERVVEP
jgi:hypothetical protein